MKGGTSLLFKESLEINGLNQIRKIKPEDLFPQLHLHSLVLSREPLWLMYLC